jgi:hypothetical protein
MTKFERDHHAVNNPTGSIVQYRCDCCGTFFFLRANFERHREIMAPRFAEWAEMKRAVWEAGRRQYRIDHPHITKLQLKAM